MEQKLRRDLNMGANLKKLRLENGYSQEKICAKLQLYGCDIIRSTYEKYEHGKLNIPISIIVTLKKIYKCEYNDFFDGLEYELKNLQNESE